MFNGYISERINIDMKKALLIILLIPLFIFFTSCDFDLVSDDKEIRDDIVKLSYRTIDYNGGIVNSYLLDFKTNEYKKNCFSQSNDWEPDLILVKTFTDDEEKDFIKGICKCGLLNIKEEYKKTGILDGGGWALTIEFEDGSTFKSHGSNDGPTKVFNSCSTYFYDLCGQAIIGNLPKHYVDPANIDYSFEYYTDVNHIHSTNALTRARMGDYKWNKNESLDNDYYELNLETMSHNSFDANYTYKMTFSTYNYDYDKRFNKFELLKYDFNYALSNEEEVYSNAWFTQIELDIELNKVYVYRLTYDDGNFVEYTFNTALSDYDPTDNIPISYDEQNYYDELIGREVFYVYNNYYELFLKRRDLIDKFNEKFFERKSLIIFQIEENSGGNIHSLNLELIDNVLETNYNLETQGTDTDMGYWRVFVTIPKGLDIEKVKIGDRLLRKRVEFHFDDSKVLVGIKKEYSEVNKVWDLDYFGDLPISSIRDLTYRDNPEIQDDPEFRQILAFELSEPSFENVIKVMLALEQFEEIEFVEPNSFGIAG